MRGSGGCDAMPVADGRAEQSRADIRCLSGVAAGGLRGDDAETGGRRRQITVDVTAAGCSASERQGRRCCCQLRVPRVPTLPT